MNRSTYVRRLFVQDREAARAHILKVIERNKGSLRSAAYEMGFDDRYMKRIIWRESLWQEVDAIRARCGSRGYSGLEIVDDEWLTKTRAVLKGTK
jgi:hypothetical protein